MRAPANENLQSGVMRVTAGPGSLPLEEGLLPALDPTLVDFVRALARRQARIDSTQAMGTAANDNQPRKSRAA